MRNTENVLKSFDRGRETPSPGPQRTSRYKPAPAARGVASTAAAAARRRAAASPGVARRAPASAAANADPRLTPGTAPAP